MDNKIRSFCILFVTISCFHKNAEYPNHDDFDQKDAVVITNKSIDSLLLYVISFTPTTIDLNKSELFEKFDIDFIFNRNNAGNESKKSRIATIIILKQYLFHLEKSNQSYDLKSMRIGKAKIIIDYFFEISKIDTTQESISSSIAYIKLTESKQNTYDQDIRGILLNIENELKRIEVYNKGIIDP